MQKGIRLNDGHVASLGLLARKDGTRKGYLSKRSSDNTKWQTKWFALLQNLLFYFESDSSSRPSGLYLLEGCVCDRAPSPKPALSAKEPLEKQVRPRPRPWGRGDRGPPCDGTRTLVPLLSAPSVLGLARAGGVTARQRGQGLRAENQCRLRLPVAGELHGWRGHTKGDGSRVADGNGECGPTSRPKRCSPPPLPLLSPRETRHVSRPERCHSLH